MRDADIRGVADVTAELQAVKREPATTTSGRMLTHLAPLAGRNPGLYAAMFALMSRSRRVRLATGTVQVTAVGMFADGAGFAIVPPTVASTSRSPLTTTSPTAPKRPERDSLLRREPVQAQPGGHRRQPCRQAVGVAALSVQPQPRLLHNVLGLAVVAQYPGRDAHQPRPFRLEDPCPVHAAHRPIVRSVPDPSPH